MDDSERSYGYSRDIYHGNRGIGGHYEGRRGKDAGPFYPGAPHFDRSYEYGAEGDPAEEPSPEEAAMHIEDRAGLRTESPEETGGAYDYDRRGTYGQVESFTWDMEGPHRGRGPKGYRRSDEQIREEICERLTAHGAIDASGIEVQVDTGEVSLEGTVADRQAKRLAEAVVEAVGGVVDIHNRLRLG